MPFACRARAPRFVRHVGAAATLLGLLTACGTSAPPVAEPPPTPRKETVHAVTAGGELISFRAGQPQQLLQRQPLRGLAAGDALVGIDYRVARGVLFALSAQGRLYTLDPTTAQLTPVGTGAALALPLAGPRFGFDFNPVADRIRIVGERGQNLRMHPDTGALVDADPAREGVQPDGDLHYAPGDASAGRAPQLLAAAYTYNKNDEKLTTNFALDGASSLLVMQGSREGTAPVVSPNTGRLTTIGPLGTGPVQDAAFDIADIDNSALAALRIGGRTRLYGVDLASGRATLLGTIGDGQALAGMAIAP
jgi:hypothetical protein